MMRFWRRSALTGVERERTLPVTPDQIQEWRDGALIQRVMPHLPPEDREWLINGTTPEEYHLLGDEDE